MPPSNSNWVSLGSKRTANDPIQTEVIVGGVSVAIEWPEGTIRSYEGSEEDYETEMLASYGYIRNTEGEDGEEVDAYVGKKLGSEHAYKITQLDHDTGEMDEYKFMLGFNDIKDAEKMYKKHMPDKMFGEIIEVPWEEFISTLPASALEHRGELWNGDSTMASKIDEYVKNFFPSMEVLEGDFKARYAVLSNITDMDIHLELEILGHSINSIKGGNNKEVLGVLEHWRDKLNIEKGKRIESGKWSVSLVAAVSDSNKGTGPWGDFGTKALRVIEPDRGEFAVQIRDHNLEYHTIRENMNVRQVDQLFVAMGLKFKSRAASKIKALAVAAENGEETPEVMKGDYETVAYIDRRGVMPDEPDPDFPIEGSEHHWAYVPDEGPTCRQCHMFFYDENGVGRCTNVEGQIAPLGSCDIYTAGPNADPKMDNPYKLPKMNVTYVVNGNDGFTCKRCTAFEANDPENPEGPGTCKILKPPVEGNGCCIAWNNPKAVYVIDGGTSIEMEVAKNDKTGTMVESARNNHGIRWFDLGLEQRKDEARKEENTLKVQSQKSELDPSAQTPTESVEHPGTEEDDARLDEGKQVKPEGKETSASLKFEVADDPASGLVIIFDEDGRALTGAITIGDATRRLGNIKGAIITWPKDVVTVGAVGEPEAAKENIMQLRKQSSAIRGEGKVIAIKDIGNLFSDIELIPKGTKGRVLHDDIHAMGMKHEEGECRVAFDLDGKLVEAMVVMGQDIRKAPVTASRVRAQGEFKEGDRVSYPGGNWPHFEAFEGNIITLEDMGDQVSATIKVDAPDQPELHGKTPQLWTTEITKVGSKRKIAEKFKIGDRVATTKDSRTGVITHLPAEGGQSVYTFVMNDGSDTWELEKNLVRAGSKRQAQSDLGVGDQVRTWDGVEGKLIEMLPEDSDGRKLALFESPGYGGAFQVYLDSVTKIAAMRSRALDEIENQMIDIWNSLDFNEQISLKGLSTSQLFDEVRKAHMGGTPIEQAMHELIEQNKFSRKASYEDDPAERELANKLSMEYYGKPFEQLEDDGEEQDMIMGLVSKEMGIGASRKTASKKTTASRKTAEVLMVGDKVQEPGGDRVGEVVDVKNNGNFVQVNYTAPGDLGEGIASQTEIYLSMTSPSVDELVKVGALKKTSNIQDVVIGDDVRDKASNMEGSVVRAEGDDITVDWEDGSTETISVDKYTQELELV